MIAVTAALLLPLLLLLLLLLFTPLVLLLLLLPLAVLLVLLPPLLLLLLSSKMGSTWSFAGNGALVMLGQVETGGLGGWGVCKAAAWTQEWIWSGVGLQE